MKRWLAFVFVLALAVALGGALSRIPRALAEVESFKVAGIKLKGARFLTEEEALRTLALPEQASVWDDTEDWRERIQNHPLVKEVKIHRRFPSTLLLEIVERVPVALFPNPTLEPVDELGRILPIDPAEHRLDLPIMASAGAEGAGSLTPAGRSLLAGEISRLAEGDPEFHARISDFTLDSRGDLMARVSDPPVIFHFRPGLPNGRIQTGLRVLADVRPHIQEGEVVDLDLRYEEQVVVRLSGARGN